MTEIDFIFIRLYNFMVKLEMADKRRNHKLVTLRKRMYCPNRSYKKYKPIENREMRNE